MSFILDALRKSENERQQDSRPNIARVPDAVPVRGLPGWAVGTMSVLAAGIVALGVLWWQSTRGVTDVSSPAPVASSSTTPLPIPPAAADPAGQAPRPAAASGTGAASTPVRLARTTLRDAAAERPADNEESGAGPSAGAVETSRAAALPGGNSARSAAPSLDPQPARYIAGQGNLPALRLELHAYDPSPTGRFVFINGTKYVEGDRLAEGPELIAVTAEGAVLLAGGQQLLLRQE